jgi:hypothetical protein
MADSDNKAAELSYLEMSDEELMNAPAPVASVAEETPPAEEDPPADEPKDEDPPADEPAEEPKDEETEDDDEGDAPASAAESDEGKKQEQPTQDAAPKAEDQPKDEPKVDYEAEYKRLLAPFKANGREIKIDNVDDAISLMQMGANYNKKMAALKPNLKLMKLLENNGLLSEEKISFLIDLGKKDPAAINKLVKDSGIDPMDLDAEKASAYRQTAYTVDDREIELDTVLDEIQGTPSYNRTLEIVSNKWDGASKHVIAQTPQLLRVINDHIQSGVYDLISKEIENERMFGRLRGVSDIEAYRQVGDSLQAKGAFNHLGKGSSQTERQPDTKPIVVPPKPRVDDEALKDKKRAASSTKPAASAPKQDFDPLSLSDEEFSKIVNKQFL